MSSRICDYCHEKNTLSQTNYCCLFCFRYNGQKHSPPCGFYSTSDSNNNNNGGQLVTKTTTHTTTYKEKTVVQETYQASQPQVREQYKSIQTKEPTKEITVKVVHESSPPKSYGSTTCPYCSGSKDRTDQFCCYTCYNKNGACHATTCENYRPSRSSYSNYSNYHPVQTIYEPVPLIVFGQAPPPSVLFNSSGILTITPAYTFNNPLWHPY